jgi:hypothetical protein
VQAYIFSVLAMVFIGGVIKPHEPDSSNGDIKR